MMKRFVSFLIYYGKHSFISQFRDVFYLKQTPREYVFEGAIQYFAGQRHRLLKLKTQATLNWFSTRAR